MSLLSAVGKLLESMLQVRLQQWAERKNLLPQSQAGFRRHRSTADALCSLLQPAFDGLQHQPMHITLMVTIDFRAAFDTVWRGGLLRNLAEAGIPHGWLRWLRSFLADRLGRVRWNEAQSNWRLFKQGVPQGSPLSPLLFLLFIRKLPDSITEASPTIDPTAFADDFTLRNTHPDPSVLAQRMQLALTATEEWCRTNFLNIAPDKTEALLVSTHPSENKAKLRPPINICGAQVEYRETIKILGVSLDSTLTLAPHAREAAKKMKDRCGALSAIAAKKWGAATDALRSLYEGYVRPAGSYAAGAWWPFLSKANSDRLESTTYTAARIITGAPAGSNAAAVVSEAGLPPFAVTNAQEAASLQLHFKRFALGHKLHRLTLPPDTRPRQKARGGGLRGSWRSCAEAVLQSAGLAGTPIQPLPAPTDTPPPWALTDRVSFHETEGTTRSSPPESRRAAAERLLARLEADGPPSAQVWSDGAAQDGVRNGGAGAIIRRRGHDDITICRAAGARTSSTSAEAAALAAGLEALAVLLPEEEATIWCAFDSRALYERLQHLWKADQDADTTAAANLIHALSARHRLHIIWVPGHAGLPLNEAADAAAKIGCDQVQDDVPMSINAAKSILKMHQEERRLQLYRAAVGAEHIHRQVANGELLPDYTQGGTAAQTSPCTS